MKNHFISCLILAFSWIIITACEPNCSDDIVTYEPPSLEFRELITYREGNEFQFKSNSVDSIYELKCISRKIINYSDTSNYTNGFCDDQELHIVNTTEELIKLTLKSKNDIDLDVRFNLRLSRSQEEYLNIGFEHIYIDTLVKPGDSRCYAGIYSIVKPVENDPYPDFNLLNTIEINNVTYQDISLIVLDEYDCNNIISNERIENPTGIRISQVYFSKENGFVQFKLTNGDFLYLDE